MVSSRRMVSGFGRIVCAIAAMLLCTVAMGYAAATVKATATKAAATTKAVAAKALTDTDCLSCHNLKASAKLQARPVSVYVNAETYQPSVHAKLGCVSCHSDIHAFPHPDSVKPVSCAGCHASQTAAYAGSVHAIAKNGTKQRFPVCLDCHGNPHGIRAKTDPKSRVYPLNLPRTCGTCHGNPELAKKFGLPDVYPLYMDSIHGFALTADGLPGGRYLRQLPWVARYPQPKEPKEPDLLEKCSCYLRRVPCRRRSPVPWGSAWRGDACRAPECPGMHQLPYLASDCPGGHR